MDTHPAPRPTGRRTITPRQLQAALAAAAPTRPPPTTPGRALAAFKRAAAALGVPRRLVDLLDCLLSYSQPQDWDGTGLGPLVWPSDAELEDRLCLGASQRKAVVRAALDRGLIRLRRSPNGKRWGYRDRAGPGGRILDAYGFDLAPLAERAAEFEQAAAEWEARREEGCRLRREITRVRNQVLSVVDLALAQALAGADWPTLAAQAEGLWRERGDHRDPLRLVPIAARLRALCIRAEEQAAAALTAVEGEQTAPTGAEYRPQHTTTTQLPTASATTSSACPAEPARPARPTGQQAGPDRPAAQGEASSGGLLDHQSALRQSRVEPAREGEARPGAQPSALRGFVVTPGFILDMAPAFRDWVASARPGWDELEGTAGYVRSALGISPQAWGQARVLLGQKEAVAVLAAICARHAAGQVRSPGGLLRRMVELHGAGTLRLDRTLFGLADKLHRRETGMARASRGGTA